MTTIDQATPTQPRTQRFYCEGCQEWHEVELLLDAIKLETEKIDSQKTEISNGTQLVAET